MTKADTSAAAVERLIAVTNGIPAFAPHNATLCALLAERDEAIDQRNAADFVLALSIEQSNRHSAERDAARAELEALRAALMRCVQYENDCGQTGRSCRETVPCACQREAEAWRHE